MGTDREACERAFRASKYMQVVYAPDSFQAFFDGWQAHAALSAIKAEIAAPSLPLTLSDEQILRCNETGDDCIIAAPDAELIDFARAVLARQRVLPASEEPRFVPVGWAGRFDCGRLYLTTHDFEADKWRGQSFPVWTVYARNDCACAACSRGELHSSDCAVHNEPAEPAGPCNCGGSGDVLEQPEQPNSVHLAVNDAAGTDGIEGRYVAPFGEAIDPNQPWNLRRNHESKTMNLPPIEVVSDRVHEAWMESKRAQGVTSRKAEDGEELMVPYTQLSEKAKELDRGTVRAVYAAIEKAS